MGEAFTTATMRLVSESERLEQADAVETTVMTMLANAIDDIAMERWPIALQQIRAAMKELAAEDFVQLARFFTTRLGGIEHSLDALHTLVEHRLVLQEARKKGVILTELQILNTKLGRLTQELRRARSDLAHQPPLPPGALSDLRRLPLSVVAADLVLPLLRKRGFSSLKLTSTSEHTAQISGLHHPPFGPEPIAARFSIHSTSSEAAGCFAPTTTDSKPFGYAVGIFPHSSFGDAPPPATIDGPSLLRELHQHAPSLLSVLGRRSQYQLGLASSLNNLHAASGALGSKRALLLSDLYVDVDVHVGDSVAERLASARLPSPGTKLAIQETARQFSNNVTCDTSARDELVTFLNRHRLQTAVEIREQLASETTGKASKERGKEGAVDIHVDFRALLKEIQTRMSQALSTFRRRLRGTGSQDHDLPEVAHQLLRAQDLAASFFQLGAIVQFVTPFLLVGRGSAGSTTWRLAVDDLLQARAPLEVLGPAGAGKTTLLQEMASRAARSGIEPLPIFVRVTDLTAPTLDAIVDECVNQLVTLEFLRASEDDNALFERVQRGLQVGEFGLFLDGIDETGSRDAAAAFDLTEALDEALEEYPLMRLICSCRDGAQEYIVERAIAVHTIAFDDRQVRSFVENWFRTNPSKGDQLSQWTKQNESIRKCVRRPLLIALLCSLMEHGRPLPTTELGLYESRLELLLDRWDEAKGMRRMNPAIRSRIESFVEELALTLQEAGTRLGTHHHVMELAEKYTPQIETVTGADEVDDLVFECMIRDIIQPEPGGYSFGHLTYQEHLAARRLRDVADAEEVLEKCGDRRWHKTLLFYAGIRRDIDGLIRTAMKTDAPSHVMECLLDMTSAAEFGDRELRTELAEQLEGRLHRRAEGPTEADLLAIEQEEGSG